MRIHSNQRVSRHYDCRHHILSEYSTSIKTEARIIIYVCASEKMNDTTTISYIGPASALVSNGYACEVRPCGTEVFCDGRIMVEIPKSRVRSSLDSAMPKHSQPFAALVTQGTYAVYLDREDYMEVFEGGYIDDQNREVSVRCHIGAVYTVPPTARKETDGAVNFSNGSGILMPSSNIHH